MELLSCFKTTNPCNTKQYKKSIQIFRTVLNLYLHAHIHFEYYYHMLPSHQLTYAYNSP